MELGKGLRGGPRGPGRSQGELRMGSGGRLGEGLAAPRTCTAAPALYPPACLARRVLAARPRVPGQASAGAGLLAAAEQATDSEARRGGGRRGQRLGDAATREGAEAGAGREGRGAALRPSSAPSSPSRLLSLPSPSSPASLLPPWPAPALLLIPYRSVPSPFSLPFLHLPALLHSLHLHPPLPPSISTLSL